MYKESEKVAACKIHVGVCWIASLPSQLRGRNNRGNLLQSASFKLKRASQSKDSKRIFPTVVGIS